MQKMGLIESFIIVKIWIYEITALRWNMSKIDKLLYLGDRIVRHVRYCGINSALGYKTAFNSEGIIIYWRCGLK